MHVLVNIALLLAGFVLLVKGADFFVDGAASLARKLKIPSLVVGLTIVAIGTGAPELAVSISAAVKGANSLAVSNVLGSNIFNLLVVLGVCALIKPVEVTKAILTRDYPVSIASMAVFFVLLMTGGAMGRAESFILLALLAGYLLWTVIPALKSKDSGEERVPFVWWKCALCIVGGAAAIVFGGNLVVDNASELGMALGMSESLVGLTICAVGTSLPELVTSISAARKGETDMAMGNVIGSNIMNVLLILGLSGAISPISISADALTNTLIDCGVYMGVCLLAYVFCLTSKRITRAEGGILLACYISYMVYAVVR